MIKIPASTATGMPESSPPVVKTAKNKIKQLNAGTIGFTPFILAAGSDTDAIVLTGSAPMAPQRIFTRPCVFSVRFTSERWPTMEPTDADVSAAFMVTCK
ncbi:MAG TPA: hypothetical protein VD867_07810, partial [Burkholderiales bacterium]|nr:hypothetical protein [Burkholderiales bacterium]